MEGLEYCPGRKARGVRRSGHLHMQRMGHLKCRLLNMQPSGLCMQAHAKKDPVMTFKENSLGS